MAERLDERSELLSSGDGEREYSATSSGATKGKGVDPKPGKCSPAKCREFWTRAGLLALLCAVNVGFFYSADSLHSLEHTIKRVMRVSDSSFALIYHVSTWPTILLTPAAGLLLDRVLGVPLGTIIYSAVACLGQLVFVVGGYADEFWVMLVGRFLLSAGEKMVIVATNAYVASWFKNKELSMAFGALHTVARLADILSISIDSSLYNALHAIPRPATRLGTALLFSLFLCFLSLACAIVLFFIDRKLKLTVAGKDIVVPKPCCRFVKCKLEDLKDFSIPFWLVVLTSLVYYSSLLPFLHAEVEGVLLRRKYMYSKQDSKTLGIAVELVSALVAPFLGIFVDFVGFHLSWFNVAIFTTLIGHLAFAFSSEEAVCPIISLLFLAIAVALISVTLPPLTAFLVQDHQLGTAYGIVQGISKLAPHVVVVVVSYIVNSAGYFIMEIVLSGLVLFALVLGILLFIVDASPFGRQLNLSAWARRELVQAEELGRKAKYAFEELPDAWTSVSVSSDRPIGIV